MAPRRRLTPEELHAAKVEATRRMKVANVAHRELRGKEMAAHGDGHMSDAERDVQQRLAREVERVAAPRPKAEVGPVTGGLAVPAREEAGPLKNAKGERYRTELKGNTVHHIYADGTDKSFKVDNMDERRALAERGVDYGAAQRASGQPANTFREGMAKILQADPSVRQQWLSAIAKLNHGHDVSAGQTQPVGAVTDTAGQARDPRVGLDLHTLPARHGTPGPIDRGAPSTPFDPTVETGGVRAPALRGTEMQHPVKPAVSLEELQRLRRDALRSMHAGSARTR